MATATDAPTTHLLTPQRVDQLVREHLDPPGYPPYPTDLITQHEALCEEAERLGARTAALAARGPGLFEDLQAPDTRGHYATIEHLDARIAGLEGQITDRLTARRAVLEALYRDLAPVAAERHRTERHRYLSDQQWLQHVQAAVAGVRRSDKRASILAVAQALAEHARSDGVFLAGVIEVQDKRSIAHSTWTRAYTWLAEQGLAATLHEARQLTALERALAIGSERHAHVHRWRAVIQLQHTTARTFTPTKWVPPSRRLVNRANPSREIPTTGPRPVDHGATRRTAAPSSRPAPKRRARRRFRRFDPTSRVLLHRLQRASAWFRGVRDCSVLPHLLRFAAADIEPAALIAAVTDAHHRAGLNPGARSLDPTRRVIWALTRLELDDVRAAQAPPPMILHRRFAEKA